MDIDLLKKEFTYRTSRSGGKGGQNVNKVETKVEAVWEIAASEALNEEEKDLIRERLGDKISAEGLLAAVNQTERSQIANKQLAEEKLIAMVEKALIPVKKRKKVPVPQSVIEARAEAKRRNSDKKETRKKPNIHSSED